MPVFHHKMHYINDFIFSIILVFSEWRLMIPIQTLHYPGVCWVAGELQQGKEQGKFDCSGRINVLASSLVTMCTGDGLNK